MQSKSIGTKWIVAIALVSSTSAFAMLPAGRAVVRNARFAASALRVGVLTTTRAIPVGMAHLDSSGLTASRTHFLRSFSSSISSFSSEVSPSFLRAPFPKGTVEENFVRLMENSPTEEARHPEDGGDDMKRHQRLFNELRDRSALIHTEIIPLFESSENPKIQAFAEMAKRLADDVDHFQERFLEDGVMNHDLLVEIVTQNYTLANAVTVSGIKDDEKEILNGTLLVSLTVKVLEHWMEVDIRLRKDLLGPTPSYLK